MTHILYTVNFFWKVVTKFYKSICTHLNLSSFLFTSRIIYTKTVLANRNRRLFSSKKKEREDYHKFEKKYKPS